MGSPFESDILEADLGWSSSNFSEIFGDYVAACRIWLSRSVIASKLIFEKSMFPSSHDTPFCGFPSPRCQVWFERGDVAPALLFETSGSNFVASKSLEVKHFVICLIFRLLVHWEMRNAPFPTVWNWKIIDTDWDTNTWGVQINRLELYTKSFAPSFLERPPWMMGILNSPDQCQEKNRAYHLVTCGSAKARVNWQRSRSRIWVDLGWFDCLTLILFLEHEELEFVSFLNLFVSSRYLSSVHCMEVRASVKTANGRRV